MSGWHATVPIKPLGERKTRLRGYLAVHEIDALTEYMLRHVIDTIDRCPAVDRITLVTATPPEWWRGDWFPDPGTGLNPALTAVARSYPQQLIVLHADLPGLRPDDVGALIDCASAHGTALAPDRHGTGTNAIAMVNARNITFQFGRDSLRRHTAMLPTEAHVCRNGLAIDVDLPADLQFAAEAGLLPMPTIDRLRVSSADF